MPDDQIKPPRSIDERLDALTMNLELQSREGEAQRERIDELGKYIHALAENSAREFADVRDSVRSLAESTSNLMTAVQSAVVRIERLERKTA